MIIQDVYTVVLIDHCCRTAPKQHCEYLRCILILPARRHCITAMLEHWLHGGRLWTYLPLLSRAALGMLRAVLRKGQKWRHVQTIYKLQLLYAKLPAAHSSPERNLAFPAEHVGQKAPKWLHNHILLGPRSPAAVERLLKAADRTTVQQKVVTIAASEQVANEN